MFHSSRLLVALAQSSVCQVKLYGKFLTKTVDPGTRSLCIGGGMGGREGCPTLRPLSVSAIERSISRMRLSTRAMSLPAHKVQFKRGINNE